MSNSNNIPITWDEESDTNLFGSLFPKDSSIKTNSTNNGLNALKTNKSFEEIFNKIAFESPLGENSIFNEINPKDFKPTKIL